MLRTSTIEAIDFSVHEAISYARDQPANLSSLEATDSEFYGSLSQYCDNTLLVDLYRRPYIKAGNQVVVNGADELTYAVRSLGRQMHSPIDERLITRQVIHERQHTIAMTNLGISALKFGFAITEMLPTVFWWQPFTTGETSSRPLTKLEFAAIHAIPAEPSQGDDYRIKLMGYKDISDLAQRIMAKNSAAGRAVIPVPFSYSLRSQDCAV